ncbi:hypothetical protein F5B22DRAFT_430523 [Xylaria bambusicola]|uniref:uncharacterized protein n=1 Tax=Xylaria bambusicola TaxID=326684 RepID=UPI002007EEE8|nr:uncharacterized protein F5B22DRAFT_430523 [Xylaria bambusicola]KAI0506952.1 hypothetical protein F5B22DRAFT_430523 [Xylaria bambusicola]
MGAKASKPAQAVSRKFPTRTPGNAVPPRSTGGPPTRRAEPRTVKDEAIRSDGRDPDLDLDASTNPAYSERLRQMGVATPFPTLSNSSTAGPFSSPSPSTYTQTSSSLSPPSQAPSRSPPPNTTTTTSFYPPPSQNRTLNALEARRELQARADAEFQDPSRGREFLDVETLRKALLLQHRGATANDIEARLRLKSGVLARLGPRGVTVPINTETMIKQTWGGLHE